MVIVTFDEMHFHAQDGSKPDLNVKGVGVRFVGPLAFLQDLAQILPSDGFSDPPVLEVTPDGITAGYSLGIPTAGVGAFSLENIALGAALMLPFFSGETALRLSFSERYHPFLVSVSLIGGGGSLAVFVNTHGVERIEGSIELGGNVTIDLVVVSANAHIMAGFHFAWDGSDLVFCGLRTYRRVSRNCSASPASRLTCR